MNVITFDFECSTFAKGNPFSKQNKAVCLGWKFNSNKAECHFFPFSDDVFLPEGDLHIAFNAKFDLHWLRRVGLKLPVNIYCAQLAEFILERQSNPYPSLEQTAIKYGLGNKLDVIKLEYWDKGVGTEEIPKSILADYCKQDVDLTYAIYLRQQATFVQNPGLYRLFKLACQDLLILADMEWNGLKYNESICNERAVECEGKMQEHIAALAAVYPGIPINFNSGHQLSAFLYGGTIIEDGKEAVGVFKSGAKKGQVKYKNIEIEHTLPRSVEPIPKSEMMKAGVFATDEATLKKLKGPFAKKYVPHLLALAKLEKLKGTYYEGIPKLTKEMDWEDCMVFPQYNQCVAATGRLSSSKPNAQNLSGDVADCFESRYLD